MKLSNNNLFLLEEIVKKNFSSKYKDSFLGILWTILQPLLLMILFTIIFSTLFKKKVEYYPAFFLTAWCTYMFFSSSISISMNVLKSNKNILQRIPAPKYIFVLGSVISEFLNFIIMLILLVAIMIITHVPFHLTIILSVIPIISLLIMITGLSLMLSIVCVYYSDVKHLWSVFSLMLMYASALFYPIEIIPEPYRHYLLLNPLLWIIDQLRCFILYGQFPLIFTVVNSLLLSVIIFVLGLIVFKKYENKVVMNF